MGDLADLYRYVSRGGQKVMDEAAAGEYGNAGVRELLLKLLMVNRRAGRGNSPSAYAGAVLGDPGMAEAGELRNRVGTWRR